MPLVKKFSLGANKMDQRTVTAGLSDWVVDDIYQQSSCEVSNNTYQKALKWKNFKLINNELVNLLVQVDKSRPVVFNL